MGVGYHHIMFSLVVSIGIAHNIQGVRTEWQKVLESQRTHLFGMTAESVSVLLPPSPRLCAPKSERFLTNPINTMKTVETCVSRISKKKAKARRTLELLD